MADWEQLREMHDDVVPPDFEGLARTARHRGRRARAALGAVAALVLLGGGFGVAALDRDTDDSGQPVKDPTRITELPDGARDLPGNDAGADFATLAGGRYRIPLNDRLAFDVDVPDDAYAHDGGLFVATGKVVLKTEIAGADFGVAADACTHHGIVPVGPSGDDLVRALRTLRPFRVSAPRPVTLGGARGTYLEARLPASFDMTRCVEERVQLPGTPSSAVNGLAPYVGRWWVLVVEGQRVMVQQACWQCTDAELDAASGIAESITFTSGDR